VDPVTDHILQLREAPAPAAALRRGMSVDAEHYAYPYLAGWWKGRPWRRQPLLQFASLCSSYPRTPQEEVSLGEHLARLASTGTHNTGPGAAGIATASLERAVGLAQSLTGYQLAQLLRGYLSHPTSARVGLDWDDLRRTLEVWDHPKLEQRRRGRRRLLEDFYQHLHSRPAEVSAQTPASVDPITPEPSAA
jgi:CRISPR type I-E-associated protein CasB/Cse2